MFYTQNYSHYFSNSYIAHSQISVATIALFAIQWPFLIIDIVSVTIFIILQNRNVINLLMFEVIDNTLKKTTTY